MKDCIIIYGAGNYGKLVHRILRERQSNDIIFCDRDKFVQKKLTMPL